MRTTGLRLPPLNKCCAGGPYLYGSLIPSLCVQLALLIDYGAMMRVVVKKRGVVREFNTKPLNVLWGLFPSMHQDNTVIVDGEWMPLSCLSLQLSTCGLATAHHAQCCRHARTVALCER